MAMADCVFHEEIMVCILTRLPVKSIIRFKSVCKPWLELLSTADLRKMHQAQFSNDHKNHSFIVHGISTSLSATMALFNIESDEKQQPTTLHHPFSNIPLQIEIVGCYNGLICISHGPMFVLWNPALNLSKTVWSSYVQGKAVSLGFGYDAVGADFKVVRIICLRNLAVKVCKGVEVYSANSHSWTEFKLDFHFVVLKNKSDVIVNGNPYWLAEVDWNKVLVCFDVTKLVFKIVPLSTFYDKNETEVEFVDWYGSLGALACTTKNKFDVWVFDDGERVWRKNHTFGPIKVNVDRFLLCLKNGRILGELPNGELILFHSESETGWVKFLNYGPGEDQYFQIYAYTESLAYIEGMQPMKLKGRRR